MSRLGILVLLVALILGCFIAFRSDASAEAPGIVGQTFGPLQSWLSGSGLGMGGFFDALREAGSLHDENVRLKNEVDAQEALKSRIIELERENREMRTLLGFVNERPDDRFLPARVIAWDPVSLVRAITLNRGRQDGVQPGMVVLTPLGLVGRVQRVTNSTAVVLLITDPSSSVSALVQGSRAKGIVDGQRANVLVMRHIEQDKELKAGDIVVTSALGGSFPDGIPIGQIVNFDRKDTGTFQMARLLPQVDFSRLEEVLVLTSFLPMSPE